MLPQLLMKGVDAIVLRNDESRMDENLFYLLGERPSRATAFLVLRKARKPLLLVSGLEAGNYVGLQGVGVQKLEKKTLAEALRPVKRKIGLNFEGLTVSQSQKLRKFTRAKQVDISERLGQMRAVKTQGEIRKIKTACRIAEEILDGIEKIIKGCRTEISLARKLEFHALNNGAEGIAFPTIVASGPASAVPHYETSRGKISKGFLVVDFGVVYDGYCSDITRTYFTGNPTVYHKHMFAVVFNAKEAATGQCVAGNGAKNVHETAEKIIEQNFGRKMMHSVGHGLGLKVHDYPESINAEAGFALKENMCITVEPGYYKQGFGGVRIEDDVVVKKGKCRELTKAERRLVVVNV